MSGQQPYNPYYGQQPPYQAAPPGSNPPPYGFQQPQPQPYMAPPPPPNPGAYQQYPGAAEDPEAQFVKHTNLQFNNVSVRAAFIRKVFMMLTVMLSIVVAMIALFIYEPNCKRFVRSNGWMYGLSYGVFLVTYIAVMCCESVRRNYPGNIICLFLLTLSMGYMTAMISAFHNINVVFLALGITVICCASIMLFASQTKYDFTSCMGVMFVISMVLFIFGIMAIISLIFFKSEIMYVIYAGLAALVFMVYLAIDIQMVIGGKRYEYSPEDYIVAAIQLFLDIIYIFIYILQILGYMNRS